MEEIFYALIELIYDLIKTSILVVIIVLGLAFATFLWGGYFIQNFNFQAAIAPIYLLAPVWLPFVLGATFITSWMRYIRAKYIFGQGSVLLEIKLPKEIDKSPAAMELVFTALYQTGAVPWTHTYFKGKVRPWFSFELASIEGRVKFFIWTSKKFKNLVESQIYAQYPTVEIYEAPDYMSWAYHDPVNLPMWATYFKFLKPNVYPIKTYVDYGMQDNPKEEYKIDPMTPVLEYLGSLRKGEHAWIQILIQAHKKLGWKDGALFPKADWKKEGKEEIERIRKEATMKVEGSEFPGFPNPTKGQQNTIGALERSLSKWPFETAIRGCYISTKESFNPISITGLIGSFRQYSSNDDLNGFKLGWFTDYDYPWQDFMRIRRSQDEREMLEAFKLRSFFQHPFKNFHQSPLILTTEELATIYHFPGSVAQTPTVERILSKKVEAPPNLPI